MTASLHSHDRGKGLAGAFFTFMVVSLSHNLQIVSIEKSCDSIPTHGHYLAQPRVELLLHTHINVRKYI